MSKLIPVEIFEAGYRPLVSVIPPGAPLSPRSTVQPNARGKTPGKKNRNGTWAGYPWLDHKATRADVKQWGLDGANIGLKADLYPGLDIDSLSPRIAKEIEDTARRVLGDAPVRVGRAPKRLMMYRTTEPFARMALILKGPDGEHLIEMLGAGRQYLVHGTHPSGSAYTWNTPLQKIDPQKLSFVTKEQVAAFFDEIASLYEILGYEAVRVGDGAINKSATVPQDGLRAPSLDALRECVSKIPNTDEFFPSREDYVKIGTAIKAAAGPEQEDDGYQIFAGWCARHEADDRVAGNPETWRADWRRFRAPYRVGWTWLAEVARPFGFNDAAHEFEAVEDAEIERVAQREEVLPEYSDAWLADQVVKQSGDVLRYVARSGQWFVWNGKLWEPDATLRADNIIMKSMRRVSAALVRHGATEKEKKAAMGAAKKLCSDATVRQVRNVLRADPRVAATPEAFDADIWKLNTPAGIYDLKTGEMHPHDPEEMCSKSTLVAPDFEMATPEFDRFFEEATGGDIQTQEYLQKLAGYALTGSVQEQILAFIWGPGWNGKSVWLTAMRECAHDYGRVAPMSTFVATKSEQHPTDMASLVGARLVQASETEEGRAWAEAKLKNLTGGEKLTARFMRQDFFVFKPQFTLIFTGNHKPQIRNLDRAMRRRIHLIPFTVVPKVIDGELDEKLRAEYPGILAWMLRGTAKWRAEGLKLPPKLAEATEEYFTEEDAVQQWITEECVETDEPIESTELYHSWERWANERGQYVGSQKRLSQALVSKNYQKTKHPTTRRMAFVGLRPKQTLYDGTEG